MPTTITRITAYDVRFPTSRHLDGSDAMNQAPDYSAAYALVETGEGSGPVGHGMTFTIGRGNEVCVKAIESLAPLVVGGTAEALRAQGVPFVLASAYDHARAGGGRALWQARPTSASPPTSGALLAALAQAVTA